MHTVLALGLVVALGALVQSSVGFGLAVVAAPVVILLDPGLMPVSLLVCGFVLPVVQLVHGPRDISWRLFGWAYGGRLLLTPVGVAIVAVLPANAIAVTVGVLVLLAVAASVLAVRVRAEPRTAFVSGLITGVSGTAAAVGGPFFALVLQNEEPVRVRSTLAAFFVGGSSAAILSLAVAGEVDARQLLAGAVWVPFLLLGHLAGSPLRRRLDQRLLRRGVLVLAVLASVGVIGRAVLGTV